MGPKVLIFTFDLLLSHPLHIPLPDSILLQEESTEFGKPQLCGALRDGLRRFTRLRFRDKDAAVPDLFCHSKDALCRAYLLLLEHNLVEASGADVDQLDQLLRDRVHQALQLRHAQFLGILQ